MKNIFLIISNNSLYSFLSLVLFIFYLTHEIYTLKKQDAFKMNSGPLTQQALFWASVRIPFVCFIYFGLFSWASSDLRFDYQGFNRFIEVSKLPLGLLSLSIPLVAVINNIHRTIQTDEQIQQTKKKNKIDEFYAHQKSHIEYFTSVLTAKSLIEKESGSVKVITNVVSAIEKNDEIIFKVESPFKLYKKSFLKASTSENEFIANPFLISDLHNKWKCIYASLKDFHETSDEIIKFSLINKIEESLIFISNSIELTPFPSKCSYSITSSHFKIITNLKSEYHFKVALQIYLKLSNEYLDIMKQQQIDKEYYAYIMQYTHENIMFYPMGWSFQTLTNRIPMFERT